MNLKMKINRISGRKKMMLKNNIIKNMVKHIIKLMVMLVAKAAKVVANAPCSVYVHRPRTEAEGK